MFYTAIIIFCEMTFLVNWNIVFFLPYDLNNLLNVEKNYLL